MARVFLGVGSNQGDRLSNVSRAIHELGAMPGVRVVQMAPIYDTEPIGGPPQPNFLNTVVELETGQVPGELLAQLKHLEQKLGRRRSTQRWGPRVIDLDILLYDDRVVNEPQLVIPHPRMHERRFVLEPLAQLASDLVHPLLGQTVAELLARLADREQSAVSP